MVRIRLSRFGRRRRPFYRLEVFDQRTRRDGRPIESLGWYDPMVTDDDKKYKIEVDRAVYWLTVGAQPTETVNDIFRKTKVTEAFEEAKKAAKS